MLQLDWALKPTFFLARETASAKDLEHFFQSTAASGRDLMTDTSFA